MSTMAETKTETKTSLSDLNPHIICVLCGGYFIDPVTLAECLHSFCKSCIVKHVEQSKVCPICEVQIHKTRPLASMRLDKTLQDIVFKIVPGLYKNEMERRFQFHMEHPEMETDEKDSAGIIFFSKNDKISMSIEYFDTRNNISQKNDLDTQNPNKRYLECPGSVRIKHLKKFLVKKYGLNENFLVDIIYKDDLIPEDYTLIDVAYAYNWRKDQPMRFFYRIFQKKRILYKRKRKRKSLTEEETEPTKKRLTEKGPDSPTKNHNNVSKDMLKSNVKNEERSETSKGAPLSVKVAKKDESPKVEKSSRVESPPKLIPAVQSSSSSAKQQQQEKLSRQQPTPEAKSGSSEVKDKPTQSWAAEKNKHERLSPKVNATTQGVAPKPVVTKPVDSAAAAAKPIVSAPSKPTVSTSSKPTFISSMSKPAVSSKPTVSASSKPTISTSSKPTVSAPSKPTTTSVPPKVLTKSYFTTQTFSAPSKPTVSAPSSVPPKPAPAKPAVTSSASVTAPSTLPSKPAASVPSSTIAAAEAAALKLPATVSKVLTPIPSSASSDKPGSPKSFSKTGQSKMLISTIDRILAQKQQKSLQQRQSPPVDKGKWEVAKPTKKDDSGKSVTIPKITKSTSSTKDSASYRQMSLSSAEKAKVHENLKSIPAGTTVTVKTVERKSPPRKSPPPPKSQSLKANVPSSAFKPTSTKPSSPKPVTIPSSKPLVSSSLTAKPSVPSVPSPIPSKPLNPITPSLKQPSKPSSTNGDKPVNGASHQLNPPKSAFTLPPSLSASALNLAAQQQAAVNTLRMLRIPITTPALPSNRLQLKVQSPTTSPYFVPKTTVASPTSLQLNSQGMFPMLGKMAAEANGSKLSSSLPKTLNQSIRNIPNPSLLTKNQNSDQFAQSRVFVSTSNNL